MQAHYAVHGTDPNPACTLLMLEPSAKPGKYFIDMAAIVYDEMRGTDGSVLPHYQSYQAWLDAVPPERLSQKRTEAEIMFHRLGITFAVYGEASGDERLIPFDIIPRIIPATDWEILQR